MSDVKRLSGFKKLKAIADKEIHRRSRYQQSKSSAPDIDKSFLIIISGGVFKAHKQGSRLLILKGCAELTRSKGYELDRIGHYIVGTKDVVSINGWDWRVISYKRGKLKLRPLAPTEVEN